jgi:phosphoenolpyruvate-protein kinase (PTS system EI component)
VESVFNRCVETFEAMEDPMFRARAADFADVGRRLLCLLLGVQDHLLAELAAPAIVVAQDLMPSDTAQMNKDMVLGFCTAGGGPLSHTAILARNLGIPAVVGAGVDILGLPDGTPLIVDGNEGAIIVEPDE